MAEEKRNVELGKIMHLTDFLLNSFLSHQEESEASKSINLELSNQISSVVFNIFKKLRYDSTSFKFTIGQKTLTVHELLTAYKASEGYVAFDLVIAIQLVSYLTFYQLAYYEIMGKRSKFVIKNRNGSQKVFNIRNLGLDNTALPFLRGITYHSNWRYENLEFMGPLTLAIFLIHENNWNKLKLKEIKDAFIESIKELEWDGMAGMICDVLQGHHQVCHLLQNIAHYLLTVEKKSQRRIYFPLLFIHRVSKTTTNFNWNSVQFSGVEAFQFYNKYARMFEWKIKSIESGRPELLAQVVFHSIFDTTTYDLDALGSTTTNSTWNKRADMDIVFTGLQSEKSDISFIPILFTKVLTSESRYQPNPPGKRRSSLGIQPMLIGTPVFSGFRKRHISDAFRRYLDTGTSSLPYGSDAYSLGTALHTLAEEKKPKLFNDEANDTSHWYNIDELGEISETVVKITIKRKPIHIYS